ncbi:hypothetical protein WJX72_000240 [[Myrmecia] bisecta]|uniref:Uncharacterized protein n=1 Tax=[Myrmecia] bisecta TaxID=41462 RepID=A0AAW1QNL7_9CHLO
MSTKVNVTGSVGLSNVGKIKGALAEGLQAGAVVVAKKKIDDVTFGLKLTEQAILGGLRNLKGAVITANKQYRYVTSTVAYDLGTKKASATLLTTASFQGGQVLELQGLWKELNNQVELQLAAKPDKTTRLIATVNPKTRAATASLAKDWQGMTLTTAYNFAKHAPAVSLSKKVSGNVVKASYAVNTEEGLLEIGRKPYKVYVKGVVGRRKGVGHPTIGFTIDREFELRKTPAPATAMETTGAFVPPLDKQAPASSSKTAKGKAEAPVAYEDIPAAGRKGKDLGVGDKLKSIDESFERKFQLNKHQKDGVDVYTYERKRH